MSVFCQCYVLSRRDLCEGPIARTEESVVFLCIIVKPGDRKVKTLNLVGAPKIMNGGEESLTFVTLYVSKFVYTIIGSNADICSGDSSTGH